MSKTCLVLALVVGCGKGDKGKEPPPADPKPANPEAVEPKPADPKPVEAKPVEKAPEPPKPDLGSCDFTVEYDGKQIEEATKDEFGVSTSHWANETDRRILYGNKGSFLLNCLGKVATVILKVDKSDKFVFTPKTYKLTPDVATAVYWVRGRVGPGLDWLGTDGTVEITAFDGTHVAGTFEAKGSVIDNDTMKTKGDATIKGKFDYKCVNNCPK